MAAPEAMVRLVAALGRLPGIGRRTAERLAVRLARDRAVLARELAAALREVEAEVRECRVCRSLTARTEDPCRFCTDPRRDGTLLCVVEDPGDIAAIEASGAFRGRYHSLLGKLSPMDGEGIADLRVQALIKRVREEGIREIILALDTDVESDATASFLHDRLSALDIPVTRIALGLPAGSGIAYSDAVTLGQALKGRRPV